jgi:hypothetical protein
LAATPRLCVLSPHVFMRWGLSKNMDNFNFCPLPCYFFNTSKCSHQRDFKFFHFHICPHTVIDQESKYYRNMGVIVIICILIFSFWEELQNERFLNE